MKRVNLLLPDGLCPDPGERSGKAGEETKCATSFLFTPSSRAIAALCLSSSVQSHDLFVTGIPFVATDLFLPFSICQRREIHFHVALIQNTGQSCIAAKRFIVVESVAEAFEEQFVQAASRLRVGDPLNRETQLGPLARAELRDTLYSQVQRTLQMGAHLLLGGNPLPGKGFFSAPTIVTQVTPEMPMFQEETFGPAAAIIHARDTEHAIALANASDFGLSCSLWTRDTSSAREIAARIEAGSVFLNGMSVSDPRLPFGGIKKSGYGRELSSFGIEEFVNIQTVWQGPAQH
jgi:succinate-semialdehyde dehydrogenase/glutarate-semialdehyde dehydrogenase